MSMQVSIACALLLFGCASTSPPPAPAPTPPATAPAPSPAAATPHDSPGPTADASAPLPLEALELSTDTIAKEDVKLHVYSVKPREGVVKATAIVLHGGPGLSHDYMRPLAALATLRYRMVFYDQRGVGRSSKPSGNGYGLEAQTADLEAVRGWTRAAQVHLLCHSTGGIVCMAYAAAHRGHVASMTLIGSLPASDSEYLASSKAFAAALARAKASRLVPDPEPPVVNNDCSALLIARLPVYYHDPKHPATANLAGSSCHADVGPPFRMELLWNGYDLRPQLALYGRPVLIIHGASDPFGRSSFEAVVKAFPNATGGYEFIEKCGHIPWEECGERFWSLVTSFLDEAEHHR